MWDWLYFGNPIAVLVVGDLSDEQRATSRQVLGGMLRECAGAGGKAVLANVVHVGIGTK